MSTLIQEYEECEYLFDLTDRFVAYGNELNDILDNIKVVYNCIKRETSSEGIAFLNSLFSTEADVANTNPTGGATGTVKDRATASTGSKRRALSSAVMNAGNIVDRMKDFMKRIGNWIVDFFGKSVGYATKLVNALTQKLTNIRNNKNSMNFKLSGICFQFEKTDLEWWINAAPSSTKEELARQYDQLKHDMEGQIVKEQSEKTKEEVSSIIQNYVSALNNIAKYKATAWRSERDLLKKAVSEKDVQKIKGHQAAATYIVNAANYLVRFIFRNSLKLMGQIGKNAFSGGQGGSIDRATADSNPPENAENQTAGNAGGNQNDITSGI